MGLNDQNQTIPPLSTPMHTVDALVEEHAQKCCLLVKFLKSSKNATSNPAYTCSDVISDNQISFCTNLARIATKNRPHRSRVYPLSITCFLAIVQPQEHTLVVLA